MVKIGNMKYNRFKSLSLRKEMLPA